MNRHTPILITLFSTLGCAFQATTGPGVSGETRPVVATTFGMTMQALRENNGIVGLRAGTAVDRGLTLKHAILHGGYDIRILPGRLTLEPGLDLGAGSPLREQFDGVGAYAGLSGTARVRVWGADYGEPSFNVIGPLVELVLMPRGGAWMPPEGSNTRTLFGEYSFELGLRVAIGSDLFTNPQGKVSESNERGSQPGGGTP